MPPFRLGRGPERPGDLFVEGEKVFDAGAFGGEGGTGCSMHRSAGLGRL